MVNLTAIAPARGRLIDIKQVDLGILVLLAIAPIQWVTLADFILNLKPFHLVLAALSLVGVIRILRKPRRIVDPSHRARFRRANGLFLLFAAYSAMLLFSSAWAEDTTEALRLSMRNTLYLVMFYGLFFYLTQIDSRKLLKSLAWGSVISILVFMAVAYITLLTRGVNPASTIITALATANPYILQFHLFIPLFNDPMEALSGAALTSSLRHTAMGFLIIAVAIISISLRMNYFNMRALFISILMFGLFIVLISVSRSLTLIMIAMMIPIYLFSPSLNVGRRSASLLVRLITLVVIVAGLTVVALFTGALDGTAGIAAQRFNLAGDARWSHYAETFHFIAERPLAGHGAGFKAYFVSIGKELQIHNIFLASLAQIGIIGLALIIVFFASWAHFVWRSVSTSLDKMFSLYCSLLFLLPAIRSMVSGASGLFGPAEWAAFTIGLSLLCVGPPQRGALTVGVEPLSAPTGSDR